MGFVPYLCDIFIPLVSYYVLTGVGLTPFWSLVIGGAIVAAIALFTTFRRGRLDQLGLLVVLEVALGLTLDLTVRQARLTLARGSLFILVAGIWILVTNVTGRPATVDATKGFAAKKGGRKGIDAFEWLAGNSVPFMRVQRWLSSVWAVMFIGYAVIRVIIVYTVTLSQAVWFTEVPGIAAFLVCMAASARAGPKLEAMVYARMDEMDKADRGLRPTAALPGSADGRALPPLDLGDRGLQLAQQAPELANLRRVPAIDEGGEPVQADLVEPLDLGAPGVGDTDEARPAVSGILD
jgi:hypothetical protein